MRLRVPGLENWQLFHRMEIRRSDAVVFDSVTHEVIMVGQGSFRASIIRQITVNENGKKCAKGLMK